MAASAGGIKAGKAYVELSIRDNIVKGLNRASAKLKAFGGSIAAIGAKMASFDLLKLAGFGLAAKKFADMGSELLDMSQRTGIAVENLDALGFAAEQSGSNLENLEVGIKTMQRGISEGDKAFGKLGISIADLKNLSPDKQFEAIAERISKIKDPAQRAGAALEIFGKSGTKLLPLMINGAAGIQELTAEAKRLGLVMSQEDAEAAEKFGDSLSAVWSLVKRSVAVIGGALVPTLQNVATWLKQAIAAVGSWIKQNSALVQIVFLATAGFAALSLAIAGIGIVVSGLGTVLGVVSVAFSGILTVIGAILSPIGLVVTALAGLSTWFLTSTEAGGQALAWLGEQFNIFKNTALSAWEGIRDAIASGDLGLAFQIVTTTLRVLWRQVVMFLDEKWQNFKQKFLNTGTVIAFGFLGMINDAFANIRIAWLETTHFLSGAWDLLITALKQGWQHFAGFFQKVWAKVKGMVGLGDADAEIAAINEEIAATNDASEQEFQKRKSDRMAERDTRKAAIREEQDAATQGLEQEHQKELAAIEKAKQAAMAADQEELEAAQKELSDLVARAKAQREETDKAREAKTGNLPEIGKQIAGQFESTSGGFNKSFIAQSAGVGRAMDRAAKATEETAKNTGVIAKGLPEMAGVFL